MDPLYLRKIRIDRLTNQQIKNLAQNVNAPESEVVQNEPQPDSKPSLTNLSSQSERLMKEMREEMLSPKQLKMNYLASMERSAYVKKIMNLPSTLPELLIQLQNPALAKDVHNVMMQPFPEPDTQKPDLKQTDKTNPDGQNKNSNNNNDNAKNNLNSNNDGFQDVLQRENNRKQAILEQYNVNNNVQNQPQNPVRGAINHNVIVSNNQVTNPEITVLNNEGVNNQVSNNEQIQIQPQGVNNTPPTVPNTQPVVNNNSTPQPVVNNEGVNNVQQPTVPNTQPVVNNNPTPQPVVNNEGVNNTPPTVPNTQPVVNNNPTPQPVVNNEGVNIVQQPTVPNTQPVVNNNPTPQPVVNNEGVNNVQQPTVPNTQPVVNNNPTPQPVVNNEGVNIVQQRPIDRVPIDNHRQPIENRRDIGINDRPPIEFKPVDTRFNYDPTRQIIDARIAMDRPPINPLNDRPFIDNRRPIIPMHEPEPEMPKPTELKQTEAAANLYANLSMNDINNPTLTQMRQRLSDDAIELLFTGLINLNELSDTIKHNGHDARSKLILAMANASRQGIDNSQIASTMKMVSESMASEENNPASILKNIIMLYLPWYPLQDGVGFNLSIETMPNSSDFSSLLKVFIQTRNYGNVNGSLVLLTGNAVDMNIQCNDAFPKSDLLDRMKEVTENHSIQSNITVEEHVQMANEMANQQAKVNLSSTFELNPFLLLMAHSFIKNTIIIDSNKIV